MQRRHRVPRVTLRCKASLGRLWREATHRLRVPRIADKVLCLAQVKTKVARRGRRGYPSMRRVNRSIDVRQRSKKTPRAGVLKKIPLTPGADVAGAGGTTD